MPTWIVDQAFCQDVSALTGAVSFPALPSFDTGLDGSAFCGIVPPTAEGFPFFDRGAGLLGQDAQEAYTGVDVLETLEEAVNYNRFLARLVSERSHPQDSILDFGAGTGTFAELIRGAGRHVSCVELDRSLRNRLNAQGFPSFESLEDVDSGSLDVVYSFNVLEHIEDDASIVRGFYDVLKPGGTTIIYVPALEFLMSGFDRRVGHLRRYRLGPLKTIVADAGFEIVDAQYVDVLGVPAGLAYKMFEDGSGDLRRSSVAFYDRFAFPFSRMLDRVFQPFLGKNILVVARKPESIS